MFATHHPDKSWLNALASENMELMLETLLVFQDPIGRLNALAPLSIPLMCVTRLVSHPSIG